MNELTNVTTGEVRLSYVHLFKPYAFQPGQEEKFCCTILVPKTDADTWRESITLLRQLQKKGFLVLGMGSVPCYPESRA